MTGNTAADQAQRNTEMVLTVMRELFKENEITALDRYWGEPYVQHNPQVSSGLDTLRAMAPGLEGFSWEPKGIAAQGDLVFTHSVVHGWAPNPVVIVAIFRLDNGRIVEHWDVIQDLTSPDAIVSGNRRSDTRQAGRNVLARRSTLPTDARERLADHGRAR